MQKLFILLILALLVALPAFAQDFGSVSGTVTTENEEPAVNANVLLVGGERDIFRTQTDREGAFAFERVPVGNYRITATLERVGTAEDDIEVAADEETVIDLVLGGGDDGVGSVSGTVFNEDREPVAGAAVVMLGGRREVFRTQTDEEGTFAFEEVPAGWYAITATFGELVAGGRLEVVADENTEIDLVLGGGGDDRGVGSVSGTVFNEDREPVAGAAVVMLGERREVFRTQTDENGAFGFEEVPAGWYAITASYEDLVAGGRLEVVADEETVIDLVLDDGGGDDRGVGSVSGTVFNERREPVANAIVGITDGGRIGLRTETDDEGAFVFERVPAGGYRITAAHREFGVAEEGIRVVANENTEVRLVLGERGGGDRECGRVRGTVSTPDEEPTVRAVVCLFTEVRGRPVWVARTVTDREGAFAFGVPAGEYHITAELEDVGVAEADIEVTAREETVIDLVLGEGEIGDGYGVNEQDANLPVSVVLLESFPNPFNAVATIGYTLPAATHVRLSVFNTEGRLIQTLSDGWQMAGEHQTAFNGRSLPTGTYILRLETGKLTQTKRLLLLK